MKRKLRKFAGGVVFRATVMRVASMVLGLVASIAIARLGGAEAKGSYSAYAAALSMLFLALNCDLPQQALRMARTDGKVDDVLPWMRRAWIIYAPVCASVALMSYLLYPAGVALGVGLWVVTVSTQSGVVAMGTRGPVNYALSSVVQQGVALASALIFGLSGLLDPSSVKLIVLLSLIAPLMVMWWRAPRSVFSKSTLTLEVLSTARAGFVWQLLRSLQTVMLKMDLLWVTAVLGVSQAGVYSVAISTAMLANIVPQQVSNQLMGDMLRRRAVDWRGAALQAVSLGVATAVPLGAISWIFIPVVYGPEFAGARWPTMVALCGSIAYGVMQVISNYVRTLGSRQDYFVFMLPGFVLMITCLLIFVPRLGVVGAAIAMAAGMTISAISGAIVATRMESRISGESL